MFPHSVELLGILGGRSEGGGGFLESPEGFSGIHGGFLAFPDIFLFLLEMRSMP